MDVALGHCWRCEDLNSQEVKCPQCGVAKYCSDTCCRRDQYRHKPECEDWRPKRCSNPKCTSPHQPLKECSSCNDASYCSQTCIKAHWKDHKHQCRERAQEVRMKGAALRSYYQDRKGQPLAVPYYFGNTLAVDMLNLEANECEEDPMPGETEPLERDYFVLSAACGNLRNWIHTAASLPAGFSGKVHTFLNDFDPFVQARNVLLLYMMVKYQADAADVATAITNIWYSLKLSEKDYNLLIECLATLQDITAADLVEVSRGVILLMEAEMAPMREVWRSWLILECRKGQPNYIDLHKQRQERFRASPDAAEGINVYRKELPKELVQSYDDYQATGVFHARGSKHRDLHYDNPTLTGYRTPIVSGITDVQRILASPKKLKFVYCILEDLHPFGSWDYLDVKRNHFHKHDKSMTVMFHGYITDQIQKVMGCLQAGLLRVSFVVWNCLELGVRLNPEMCRFDRIFTSNMADYSGTQPLLKAMKPFLNMGNKRAVIVTQYWNWYTVFPDARVNSPESKRDQLLADCNIAATKDLNIDAKESSLKIPTFMMNELKKVMTFGYFFLQEYFNNTRYFVSYLRAEYVAFNEPPEMVDEDVSKLVKTQNLIERMGLGHDMSSIPNVASGGASAAPAAGGKKASPPTFQKVKQREGLKLRDFRRGEFNRVAPFRYRRNVRRVNHFRGMERMLEWYIPE